RRGARHQWLAPRACARRHSTLRRSRERHHWYSNTVHSRRSHRHGRVVSLVCLLSSLIKKEPRVSAASRKGTDSHRIGINQVQHVFITCLREERPVVALIVAVSEHANMRDLRGTDWYVHVHRARFGPWLQIIVELLEFRPAGTARAI